MLVRRLALATFAVLLLSGGAAATESPAAADRPDSLSRDDILAGRASQGEQRRALRASIELAGGESVEVAGAQSSGLGGYGQALIAADLDGDEDEEILFEQFVGSRRYVLAADDNGVLWRRKIKRGPWFAGYLVDDFAAGGGNEVLMIAHQWLGEAGQRVIFGLVGRYGLLWTYEAPGAPSSGGGPFQSTFHEINGSVQADGDDRAELAITTWSDYGHPKVITLDGDVGEELGTLEPSLETDNAAFETYSQSFVTDGASDQSDEAVFMTSLPTGGYFAERLLLTDGTRTDYEVIALGSLGDIYQGLDYSGDGRRDAYTDGYTHFGVFDPVSFTSWKHEHDYGSLGYPEIPDPVGDLDGDGGEDLCALLSDYVAVPDVPEYENTAHIDCRSGKTGARLWTAASPTVRNTETTYGWSFIVTRYDINGDAHPDPILGAEESVCGDQGWPCETVRFEASAVDGKTGSGLWSLNDPARESLMWSLTEGNLDEVPGDDLFVPDEDSDRAEFQVLNGRTMEPSWHAVVDPDSDWGRVLDWSHADVDGDGTTEAVVTAYATTRNCTARRCSPRTSLYLTAFSGTGQILWQVEL
jgi:hypothetical protein